MKTKILKRLNKENQWKYILEYVKIETTYNVSMNLVWLIAIIFVTISVALLFVTDFLGCILVLSIGVLVCMVSATTNTIIKNMLIKRLDQKYGGS